MKPTQADSEIQQEHLFNFVVNSLDEELVIDLAENVEVTTEKLYEVLAGGTSVNQVCETTGDSPYANTVRGHLTDQFDLDTVEAVGDTLPQRDVLDTLPDRPMEVCADLHLYSYYGDEDETEALYFSQVKRGVSRARDKRYTLATPPAMSSLSSSNSSTISTSVSRPSTLIADSTTAPVSD